MDRLQIVLISTYELGRQPFGLASPAAWLTSAGFDVSCQDLAINALDLGPIQSADLLAFYLPMHTATRIAAPLIQRVQRLNPRAHVCCYGLYAPLNARYLYALGVQTILGGEFEAGLLALAQSLPTPQKEPQSATIKTAPRSALPVISLGRQHFLPPNRAGLPPLDRYAHLEIPDGSQRTVGYTEATRGCKHRCRHCPIVPVYGGQFRIIQREIVLADIRNQVMAGATHITFGDPDFFNGPGHAIAIVEALHREFPELTYDVTIKIEHLVRHDQLLPTLKATGCLFITSAVEAVDDQILQLLNKGHTRQEFIDVVKRLHELELQLNPTFVAFNPWIRVTGYRDLLQLIAELDLVDHIAPIQYAIRLLITAESALLTLPSIQALIHPFDQEALVYPWIHPEPAVDALQEQIITLVENAEKCGASRREIFGQIWTITEQHLPMPAQSMIERQWLTVLAKEKGKVLPKLSEPWYC